MRLLHALGSGLRAIWPLPALLVLVVLAAQLAWATGGPVTRGVVVVALINLVLVVGLYIFVGNSGVFSFGSIGLAAVGAYTAGLLVIPVELEDDPAARVADVHRGDELRHRRRDADGRPRRGCRRGRVRRFR